MLYATVEDVRAVVGRPWASSDEQAQWSAWCEEASSLVDEAVAGATARATADPAFAAAARHVCTAAVKRAVDNPSGMQAEAVDDWRGTRPAETAAGGVYLLGREVSRLVSWGTPRGLLGGAVFVSVSG